MFGRFISNMISKSSLIKSKESKWYVWV